MLRFWVIRHGVIAASRGGKLKTLLQAVAIGLYVLPLHGWLHVIAVVVMVAAVVVALVTGVDYVARAMRLRRRRPGRRRAAVPSAAAGIAECGRRSERYVRRKRRTRLVAPGVAAPGSVGQRQRAPGPTSPVPRSGRRGGLRDGCAPSSGR